MPTNMMDREELKLSTLALAVWVSYYADHVGKENTSDVDVKR